MWSLATRVRWNIHECSVRSSGKAIDCIVITWAGCNPTHQTIQPTTSPWQSSNQTQVHVLWGNMKAHSPALAKQNKTRCLSHCIMLLSASVCFDWTAWLPIWRWQSASGWLSCLLGKDSRLYSYLKKRLHNPTTIQSTTSGPRTASTLLQHQRSTKVTFLQWYKEKETEGYLNSLENTCKIKLGRAVVSEMYININISAWCVQTPCTKECNRIIQLFLCLILCFCRWKWFKISTYGWKLWVLHESSTAKIWRDVHHLLTKEDPVRFCMLAHRHRSTKLFYFFSCLMQSWRSLRNLFHENKSKTNNLTVSRHRKVRALMCESPTNNSLASWDSGMWSKEEKKKRAARLCARNSFPFLPKTELIPVGYPCVGWLLLLRRRYTHRCLQIWLPPAASDWIQGWDSAPQNTTRKHKMAPRTSAILGLLKSTIRSTFEGSFSKPAVSWLRKSGCSIESDGESILCQALRRSQQIQTTRRSLSAGTK